MRQKWDPEVFNQNKNYKFEAPNHVNPKPVLENLEQQRKR